MVFMQIDQYYLNFAEWSYTDRSWRPAEIL